MTDYLFSLFLKSDAELSSGLGNELLNSLLPRGANGEFIIPASHLKGIMRENLFRLLSPFRTDTTAVCNCIFGHSGEKGNSGQSGILHLSNAIAVSASKILHVTRTAIADNGIAEETSLRTTEALGCGCHLEGKMSCSTTDPVLLKLCRLALLSVFAVGGGRTRGAGACKIAIQGFENDSPGALLREIITAEIKCSTSAVCCTPTGVADARYKTLKLHFTADAPLCLPERPVGQSNFISSGFVIPGTAMAGTLLTLLSQESPQIASDCFYSALFRCFPCLPVINAKDCLLPVLVSNSHKISKTVQPDSGKYLFGDLMIPDKYLEAEYHWQTQCANVSMKGTNGVLIVRKNNKIELLKSGDIARYYTAHGVINSSDEDKRDNLFSKEAICAKEFSGIVTLPEKAAELLRKILKDGRRVFFGKAKSTMGSGLLTAELCPLLTAEEEILPQVSLLKNRLFIVQSPIVYDAPPQTNSRDIINSVLLEAGWGEVEEESITTSVLFGWNNAALGEQIDNTGRTKARRVIVPGSIFLLKKPLGDLQNKIVQGLGCDRYAGYGAVLPHPMFACELCKADVRNPIAAVTSKGTALHPVYCGYELDKACQEKLSASQIANLMSCADISKDAVRNFLNIQKERRPDKNWEKWKCVYETISKHLEQYSKEEMYTMFRVWHDLRSGRKEK